MTHPVIAKALAKQDARAAAETPVDYQALNKMVKRQRAALTRAKNSGDLNKLVETVQAAVREWNRPGAMWPDDWSNWQRALDDALPWNQHVDIANLG